MKQGFEDRFDEVENTVFLAFGEKVDKGPRPGLIWRVSGIGQDGLRGMEDRVEFGQEDSAMLQETKEVVNGDQTDGVRVERETSSRQRESRADEVAALRKRSQGASRRPSLNLREEREDNNRQVIQAVMEGMRKEYTNIVRKVSQTIM